MGDIRVREEAPVTFKDHVGELSAKKIGVEIGGRVGATAQCSAKAGGGPGGGGHGDRGAMECQVVEEVGSWVVEGGQTRGEITRGT